MNNLGSEHNHNAAIIGNALAEIEAKLAVALLQNEKQKRHIGNLEKTISSLKSANRTYVANDLQRAFDKEHTLAENRLKEIKGLLGKIKRLEKGLSFYASGNHFEDYHDQNITDCKYKAEAENVSGEPVNLLEGHGDYQVEDGTIAFATLNKGKHPKVDEWLESAD